MVRLEQSSYVNFPVPETPIKDYISQIRPPLYPDIDRQVLAGNYQVRTIRIPKSRNFSRQDYAKPGSALRYPSTDGGRGILLCGLDGIAHDYQFDLHDHCRQFVEIIRYEDKTQMTTTYSFDLRGNVATLVRDLRLMDKSRIREVRNFKSKPNEPNYRLVRLNSTGIPLPFGSVADSNPYL